MSDKKPFAWVGEVEAQMRAELLGAAAAGPPDEIAQRLQGTRDVAEADRASGHLTTFWYERVRALCRMVEFFDERALAGGQEPPGELTIERLTALLDEMFNLQDDMTTRDEAKWLLLRLRALPSPSVSSEAAPPALWAERNAGWEGGWVLHFPTESIAIATFERERGRVDGVSVVPPAPSDAPSA